MASKDIAIHRAGVEIYHGATFCKQKAQELLDKVKDIGVSSYATEMTGFLEDRRMRKLTGIKSKEMMIWIILSDISIDRTDSNKIIFTTSMGLSKSFPLIAFEIEPEL
ncbi:hypothetical protein V6N13_027821 [Hibiscus sabdariffa]